MSLILTILNKPNPGQEISSAFKTEGSIGRAPTNSWVLVDPERSTSSNHAQINSSNGEYFITDTSTNGVYVNNSNTPIGKGNSTKLSQGDQLKIGDYEISVTIQADDSIPLGEPDGSPFSQQYDFGSPTSDVPTEPPVELGQVNESASIDIGGDNPLDPLAMLNNTTQGNPTDMPNDPGSLAGLGLGINPPFPLDVAPSTAPSFPAGTSGDNASPMQQQFEPPLSPQIPASSPDSGAMIPDDWDIGSPLGSPLEQQTPVSDAGNSAANASFAGTPVNETNSIPDSLPSLDDLLGGSPESTSSAPPDLPATPIPASPADRSPSAPTSAPSNVSSVSTNTELMQNLLNGMGLQNFNLSPEQEQAFTHEVGQFVRTTVEGLLAVLRARASIKSEFRMSMTIIQARENNPLKFSPTGMDALNHLFSPSTSSYMPPIQAVNESFSDMEAHMIAVMAGMQTALHAVLKRFDPAMLERDFESREKAKGFSLGGKKAKYWDIYNTHYKEIIASVEDDFHTMFGDEFSRAYEAQVARLKKAKNSQA